MTEQFKALAHENRLAILALLSDQPLCGCDFEENLNLSQSNVSRHLTVLKNANIIKSYKTQQWVYFAVDQDFIDKNLGLWLYLRESFNQEPYKTIRKNFSAASNCSGPIPIELTAYRLEKGAL